MQSSTLVAGDGEIEFGEFGVRGFKFGRKMNIDV